MDRTGDYAFLYFDPLDALITEFNKQHPGIPVRVNFNYEMIPKEVPALVTALEPGDGPGPRIHLNPHRKYTAILNAAIEALAICSFWTEEDGLPENGDPRVAYEDNLIRQRAMAGKIGKDYTLAMMVQCGTSH